MRFRFMNPVLDKDGWALNTGFNFFYFKECQYYKTNFGFAVYVLGFGIMFEQFEAKQKSMRGQA